MSYIHPIDIGIVIIYLIICVWVGLHKFNSVKTLQEYTLGRGYLPDVVIVSTIFATHIGAVAIFGIVGKIYELGMFCIISYICAPFVWLIMAKIYGKNINQFRGCMSVSDIMEVLYGYLGRWITNITAILFSIATLASQAVAMGYLLHYFLQIPAIYCTIVSTGVLALYSAFGGVRAVATTDVFQLIILITIMPLACSQAYHNSGGYSIIRDSLPAEMLTLNLDKNNLCLFLSLAFFGLLPKVGPPYIQRFLISKNSQQLVRCMKAVAVIHCIFIIIMCLVGLLIKATAPDIDYSTTFLYFTANHLYVGMKGLVISGLLAAIMSTADSFLNTTSVLITHDIVKKLIPLTEKQALTIARVSTFVIAILAVLLSLSEKGIMELIWLAGNFWSTIIMIPLTVGFLKFRTNSKSFIASVVLAIAFTCISGYTVGDLATVSVMCGTIGSIIGLFGMHYWQKYNGITPKNKSSNTYRTSSADVYNW